MHHVHCNRTVLHILHVDRIGEIHKIAYEALSACVIKCRSCQLSLIVSHHICRHCHCKITELLCCLHLPQIIVVCAYISCFSRVITTTMIIITSICDNMWPTQPSIPLGSVNEYQLRLGRQSMVHSVSG